MPKYDTSIWPDLEGLPPVGNPLLATELANINPRRRQSADTTPYVKAGWALLGEGSYRSTWAHPDSPGIAYKLPHGSDAHNVAANQEDVGAVQWLARNHPELCRWLPAVYLWRTSEKVGVATMEQVKPYENSAREQFNAMQSAIYKWNSDIKHANCGINRDGNLVQVDWGNNMVNWRDEYPDPKTLAPDPGPSPVIAPPQPKRPPRVYRRDGRGRFAKAPAPLPLPEQAVADAMRNVQAAVTTAMLQIPTWGANRVMWGPSVTWQPAEVVEPLVLDPVRQVAMRNPDAQIQVTAEQIRAMARELEMMKAQFRGREWF